MVCKRSIEILFIILLFYAMQFTGRVISKSKPVPAWTSTKVEVHLEEIKDKFPDSILVAFFWEKVSLTDDMDVGDTVGVEYNAKVTEYNDRKYNNNNAWKIISIDKSSANDVDNDDEFDKVFDSFQ